MNSAYGDVGVSVNETWSVSCAPYPCLRLCPVSGHWSEGEGSGNFSCGTGGDDGKGQESIVCVGSWRSVKIGGGAFAVGTCSI